MTSPIFEAAISQWRALRAEYETLLENSYARAERECHGVLLNARGKAKGVDAYSLFKGNAARAHAYASEELIDHWRIYPRVTFADFERMMIEELTEPMADHTLDSAYPHA